MPTITFLRHAESQSNADGIWSGRSDVPLSRHGEETLEGLGQRLRAQDFDVVISSPLQRARLTAASFAGDNEVEIWDDFIELDLGRWDGMTVEEVMQDGGAELKEAVTTRILPMGGTGETLNQVGQRAISAMDRLADQLGEDGHAAVVTHGGLLQTILHRHLAGGKRRIHAFTENTAISRINWSFGRPRLATFNDLGHLGSRSSLVEEHLSGSDPVVALIRHGRTQANVEGRWQGQGDWGLDDLGRLQAQALVDWYGRTSTVYSSPLGRARQTADYVASNGVIEVDDLRELAMGEWEGLTSPEIAERWGDRMETIYRHGVDLKRGETGESWGELTARFRSAVHALETAPGEPTVVVAHGGAIRSYVSSLTALDDSHAESLFTPANTSVTHVAMTSDGPLLLDYAVAPHLESML